MKWLTFLIIGLLHIGLVLLPHDLQAQHSDSSTNTSTTYIRMEVLGLACPFCAYGLEKDLRQSLGARDVHITLQKGLVYLTVPSDQTPSEEQLKDIVRQAGFTPGEIRYSSKPFDTQKAQR